MKISSKIILLTTFVIFILSSNIFAIDNILADADDFITTGKNNAGTTINTIQLKKTSDIIYNVFFGIGVSVALIVGAILGIQFMTAGVDKKVEVKEALVPYLISCVVVFGSFGIWKLIVTILNGIDL